MGSSMSGRMKQQLGSFATRSGIAEAAAQEFLEHGYAGASLARIAGRLGLTKGALVYHFRAKADFASYFVDVVRQATRQANAFAKETYPNCGPRRLLLYFLVMGAWREKEQQVAAGIALFADRASPAYEADDVIRDWLALSVEGFEASPVREHADGETSPLEAAEMFLVTNLGALFFGRHVRLNAKGTEPLRFLRLALTAVGVSDVDKHTQDVIDNHSAHLPELRLGPRAESTV